MGNIISARLRLYGLVAVLLAATAFPASGIASSAAGRAPAQSAEAVASSTLSPRERLEVFDKVWEEVNDKYYDPNFNGVNWRAMRGRYRPLVEGSTTDDDFYAILKRMVGELRDAHTRFHTPRERRDRKQLQTVSAGVQVFDVEGQPVIIGVDPTSEAARRGVEPGMVVLTVDDKSVSERLAQLKPQIAGSSSERANKLRLYRRVLDGEAGTPVKLGLRRANGTLFEVTITRRVVPDAPTVSSQRLPSGYGYIKLNIWKSPIAKDFKNALDRLKDAPGLIIDLRGNPGGEVNEVLKIASYFFSTRVPFGKFITRSGRSLELSAGREESAYKGTVAILINESSGSGSEMFSGVMQETGRAVLLGRQTCGCLLGIAKFREMEGGGELAISELGYLSPGGRKLEGNGVMPDEQVGLRIADLQNRRDAFLQEAENLLRSPLKSSSSAR